MVGLVAEDLVDPFSRSRAAPKLTPDAIRHYLNAGTSKVHKHHCRGFGFTKKNGKNIYNLRFTANPIKKSYRLFDYLLKE